MKIYQSSQQTYKKVKHYGFDLIRPYDMIFDWYQITDVEPFYENEDDVDFAFLSEMDRSQTPTPTSNAHRQQSHSQQIKQEKDVDPIKEMEQAKADLEQHYDMDGVTIVNGEVVAATSSPEPLKSKTT